MGSRRPTHAHGRSFQSLERLWRQDAKFQFDGSGSDGSGVLNGGKKVASASGAGKQKDSDDQVATAAHCVLPSSAACALCWGVRQACPSWERPAAKRHLSARVSKISSEWGSASGLGFAPLALGALRGALAARH
jgi:hypothetical protein